MAALIHDVLIVGGGPAGTACAAMCARNGLRTLLIERAIFPREKVCGDCLNPGCWPILDRLGVTERVLALPHAPLAELEFIGLRGQSIQLPLGDSAGGEIAVKRSWFDQVLLQRALEDGAVIRAGCTVTACHRRSETSRSGWEVEAGGETFRARMLVAADGRNSSVARLLGLLPGAAKDRVALQTHLPLPENCERKVVLRFLRDGYCGLADVGDGQANLCLVARPQRIEALQTWAVKHFGFPAEQSWRTVTPLARAAIAPTAENLFLVGDAARVVEPFTGEGIFYALASGELAARHLVAELREKNSERGWPAYRREHATLYRGRLWINQLAKQAVLHPRLANLALNAARIHPRALALLTARVVGKAHVRPA